MATIELSTGAVVVAQNKTADQIAHTLWATAGEAQAMVSRRSLRGAVAVETVNGTVYVNGNHVVSIYDEAPADS